LSLKIIWNLKIFCPHEYVFAGQANVSKTKNNQHFFLSIRLAPMLIAMSIVLALLFLILTFSTYLALSSITWPQTKGIVIDARINQRKTKSSGSSVIYFVPAKTYEYVVNGKKNRSSRLDSRLLAYDNEPDAVTVANLFPLNAEVGVYYHPLFTSISCLRTGIYGKWIYVALYFFCLTPLISIAFSLV
jgi:hypothetical protein